MTAKHSAGSLVGPFQLAQDVGGPVDPHLARSKRRDRQQAMHAIKGTYNLPAGLQSSISQPRHLSSSCPLTGSCPYIVHLAPALPFPAAGQEALCQPFPREDKASDQNVRVFGSSCVLLSGLHCQKAPAPSSLLIFLDALFPSLV